MYLEKILEDVLPTKWSRWTSVLTVLTSIAVLPLPYLWPFSVLIKTDTERQIFQVLLLVSTLLIGTLICLLLVVIEYHKKTKELSDEIHKLKHPAPIFFKVNAVTLNETKK